MDLLINQYGLRVRSSGERIVLWDPKSRKKTEYPVRRLDKIVVLRPSSISMGAVELALKNGVDIVYLGSFGKPLGRIFPSAPKGMTKLRRAQIEAAVLPAALELAKAFMKGKAESQLDYLKYLANRHKISFERDLLQAETLLNSLSLVPDSGIKVNREYLFGIEGFIADKYFSCLKRLYYFYGRNPRGRDRFNSALNYGYGILYNEIESVCLYVGLDPYLGFYHSERYGKRALVLDLIEEFRVPAVDSAVFPLFVAGKITSSENFERVSPGQYQLSKEGRRKVVEAVFKNLHSKVKWGGELMSLQGAIRHQARSLAQIFLGRRKIYNPFKFNFESNEQLELLSQ